MKVFFVTNICPHYRVKAFELLARVHDTRFFFFSNGNTVKHWERNNPTSSGAFDGGYVKAWTLFSGRLRFVPGLYKELLFGKYDVLIKCINGKMPLLLSFLIARLRGIPFVLWTELWYHPETLVHRVTFPIVRWIYRNSDAMVVCGGHVRAYLTGLGVSPEKIFMGWQAVDNETLSKQIDGRLVDHVRRDLGVDGRQIVLYVGRLEEQKGIAYLAEAMAKVSNERPVALVVIGTGSRADDFHQMLNGLGFSDYRFVGFVPNDVLPVYYRVAEVLVLPSVTTITSKEVWGLVVNEAMNQGCPVITTDAVGAAIGGLVKDGKSGLIVPERDSEALANAIIEILTNAETRLKFSRESLTEIRQWTYERMVQGFSDAAEYAREHRH